MSNWIDIGTFSSMDSYFKRHKNVYCVPHFHRRYEIVYNLSGKLHITIGKKKYLLEKNDMAIIMPYEIHAYENEKDSLMTVFEFPAEFLAEEKMLSGLVFENPVCRFSQYILDNITHFDLPENNNPFFQKSLAYASLMLFLKNSRLIPGNTSEDDVLIRAGKYISNNYKNEISLSDVAKNVGVTPVHLSRVFGKYAGFSFTETVNCLRANEAGRLLFSGKFTISEIAMLSGFGSIRNFNRVFLHYYGKSPCEIRKEMELSLISGIKEDTI